MKINEINNFLQYLDKFLDITNIVAKHSDALKI